MTVTSAAVPGDCFALDEARDRSAAEAELLQE